jgi:hypothetical protein
VLCALTRLQLQPDRPHRRVLVRIALESAVQRKGQHAPVLLEHDTFEQAGAVTTRVRDDAIHQHTTQMMALFIRANRDSKFSAAIAGTGNRPRDTVNRLRAGLA